MAKLPESDVFRRSVKAEVWKQFRASMKGKLVTLFAAVAAMIAIFALDSMRTEFKEWREKPYTAANVAEQLKVTALPEGRTGEELAQVSPHLRVLRKAGQAIGVNDRYASADDAFNAVLAKTSYAADVAKEQTSIRAKYAGFIAAKDRAVGAALTAPKPAPAEPADPAKAEEARKEETKKFDALKKERTDLVTARTAELTEAEQRAAVHKAELRRLFDDLGIAEKSKAELEYSTQPALNRFAEHVADPEHPLSLIYDLFWYAAIAIGVVALIALLLTPLFNAVPVAGANERFMDQIRGLFGRAPTRVGMSVARVAAVTIGTAAIVSVATTAPSSPLYESSLMPPPAAQEESEKKKKDETKKQDDGQNTATDTTGTSTVTDTTGTGPTSTPCTSNCTPADPRVDGVLTKIASLESTDGEHAEKLGTHGTRLDEYGRKFGTYDQAIEGVKDLPTKMATLIQEETEQKDFLSEKFGTVDREIDRAHFKAESAEMRANEVDEQVTQARSDIELEAKTIRDGVEVPLRVGERPSLLRSVFGFDRYQVTKATATYVEKAGAPDDIVQIVTNLTGDDVMSNDALRLRLRDSICGKPENCTPYLRWRNTVIRGARMQ
jgi:hypothetical protein